MNPALRVAWALGLAVAASMGLMTRPAHAYDLRQSTQGKPIRWQADRVAFAVDPGVEKAVPGAASVIREVILAWSERGGAPALVTTFAQRPLKAAVDGINSILIAPPGFAAMGSALAITLTSYDEPTGAIVDTDILINGEKAFAVLGPNARARLGAPHVATDDAPLVVADAGVTERYGPFDFPHVFAHEVGHALGLGDSSSSPYALMYAYTTPGDASARAPTSDDVDGITAQYAASNPHAAEEGCTSSGSGPRAQATGGPAPIALTLLCGTLVAKRRARSHAVARTRIPASDLKRKTR